MGVKLVNSRSIEQDSFSASNIDDNQSKVVNTILVSSTFPTIRAKTLLLTTVPNFSIDGILETTTWKKWTLGMDSFKKNLSSLLHLLKDQGQFALTNKPRVKGISGN